MSKQPNGVALYTIGFTKKKAGYFFGKLRLAGVKRVLDVRLNNVSQLAGFAKRDDLAFFLEQLGGMECGWSRNTCRGNGGRKCA